MCVPVKILSTFSQNVLHLSKIVLPLHKFNKQTNRDMIKKIYVATAIEYYGDGRRKQFDNECYYSKDEALKNAKQWIDEVRERGTEVEESEDTFHDILKHYEVKKPLMFTGEMKTYMQVTVTESPLFNA